MGKRVSFTSKCFAGAQEEVVWCVVASAVLCCAVLRCAAVCRVVSCLFCCCLSVVVCWIDIVVLLVVCLLCGERKRCYVYDGPKNEKKTWTRT